MKNTRIEVVRGGAIAREAQTGRIVSVKTPKGTNRASVATEVVVRGASSKRKDALKRLVNR
jgi:hypothetical protein